MISVQQDKSNEKSQMHKRVDTHNALHSATLWFQSFTLLICLLAYVTSAAFFQKLSLFDFYAAAGLWFRQNIAFGVTTALWQSVVFLLWQLAPNCDICTMRAWDEYMDCYAFVTYDLSSKDDFANQGVLHHMYVQSKAVVGRLWIISSSSAFFCATVTKGSLQTFVFYLPIPQFFTSLLHVCQSCSGSREELHNQPLSCPCRRRISPQLCPLSMPTLTLLF